MDLTNGPLGLPGVPPLEIALPGLPALSLRTKTAYYYLVLVAVAPRTWCASALIRSRVGRALRRAPGERDAGRLGRHRRHALPGAGRGGSAAMAGVGGGLYAHYTRFVSPEVFLFTYTVTMVIMVVAGGKGTLAGPIVGAVLFTVLPEALRAATSWQWQMLLYGVLLVRVAVLHAAGHRAGPARRRPGRPAPLEPVVILEAHDLTVRFGGVAALAGVSFAVAPGHRDQPDRPERRGQDHRLQRDHRLPAADAGRRSATTAAHHRLAAARGSRRGASCARSRRRACSRA